MTLENTFDILLAAMEPHKNMKLDEPHHGLSSQVPSTAIFVYGTLRTGASNHWRMLRAKWLANATVIGKLFRIDWYPGLVLDARCSQVHGEIYLCDAAVINSLDAFEGTVEYRRVSTTAIATNGDAYPVQLWEFQLPTEGYEEIVSGDWLKH